MTDGGDSGGRETARRLLGLLGLANRAGRLALGAGAVTAMVERGEKPLVFVARDSGRTQTSRAGRLSPVAGVVTDALDGEDMARALGRGKLTMVAVSDREFVRGLKKILEAAGDGGARKED